MLLFIAALRNIPRSYLEAAELDGGERVAAVLPDHAAAAGPHVVHGRGCWTTIGSMKEFALIQALNDGGPGTANNLIVQYI